MKRFTLVIIFAACVLCLSAQSAFHVSKPAGEVRSESMAVLSEPSTDLVRGEGAWHRGAKHPVDEQPEGELKTYSMYTLYFTRDMGEPVYRYGQKTMIVINKDEGEIWIQNIINTFLYGTWIRGEISADHKKVVFENFQPYLEQGDYTYYVSLAYQASNGDYYPDTEADEFSFDYDEETGVLSNPTLALTLSAGEGNANTLNIGYEFTPFTDELVQLPGGKTIDDAQSYSLKWTTSDPYYLPYVVKVLRDGNDFYFNGFYNKTPDAWLKGTLNEAGDQVIIPNGQYMGLYDGLYFIYNKGAYYSGMDDYGWPIYKNKDNVVLQWNEEDKSLFGPDGILFVLGKELKGGYSHSIPQQDMKPFYGVPAKPKTPDIRYFDIDTQYQTVNSSIAYLVPVEDVHGNFIDPDSLYYRVFLDGEQLHFDNVPGGFYQHFPDEWEVPSRFTDRGKVNNRTDNNNGTQTYHVLGVEKSLRPNTIGLQSIYYMNGTRTLSDVCVYNTATKEKTIVEGDPDPAIEIIDGDVNGDGQVGIGDIISVTNFMADAEQSGVTLKQADVNGDGQVGIGDIISITNIMAGVQVVSKTPAEMTIDGQKLSCGNAFIRCEKEDSDKALYSLYFNSFDWFQNAGNSELAQIAIFFWAPKNTDFLDEKITTFSLMARIGDSKIYSNGVYRSEDNAQLTISKKDGVYSISIDNFTISGTNLKNAVTSLSFCNQLGDLSDNLVAEVLYSDYVYTPNEQMPQFPGGTTALSSWLSQHLTYPVDAEENGIQGRVICAFVVDRDGTVTDVAVKTSVDPSLDNEATRVVASIPSWIPGLINGDFVKVKYTIPISFVLQSSQRSNTKSALAPQIIVGDCQIEKEVK